MWAAGRIHVGHPIHGQRQRSGGQAGGTRIRSACGPELWVPAAAAQSPASPEQCSAVPGALSSRSESFPGVPGVQPAPRASLSPRCALRPPASH